MKIRLVFFIALISCQACELLHAQIKSEIELNKNHVNLKATGLKLSYCIGCKIPFTIALESKEQVEVFDLETAWLGYTLDVLHKDGKDVVSKTLKAGSGGSYTYLNDTVTGETVYIKLKQTRILLEKNQNLDKGIELISLFKNGFFGPGEYALLIEYEGQIQEKIQFEVLVDYENSIPALITSLKNKEVIGGLTAYYMIYYLVGFEGFNEVSMSNHEAHFKDVSILENWWENNKTKILKIESVLSQEKYVSLEYQKRVPQLIRLLKSKDFQLRLAARNELYDITGIPEWTPSINDTEQLIKLNSDEISKWWKGNEKLFVWINNVITENKID